MAYGLYGMRDVPLEAAEKLWDPGMETRRAIEMKCGVEAIGD